ncbi:MAG: transglutaminase family protein [Pseudomonadota bacterium]
MRLEISHTTTYAYAAPMRYGLQRVRMCPETGPGQSVQSWSLILDGGVETARFKDAFGNQCILVETLPDQAALSVTCEGVVETENVGGVIGKTYGVVPIWVYLRSTELTTPGPALRKLFRSFKMSENPVDMLHAMSAYILAHVPYEVGRTFARTPAEAACALRGGVCQDHAQIMIAMAHLAGFPARYVSGYLMMEDRVDQDASHAWAEIWVEDLGWVGFDVSNGISPDERYVRIAVGRDYRDAAPLQGVRWGTGEEKLQVALQVQQ